MKDWPTKSEMLVMQILQNDPQGLYGLQVVDKSDNQIKRGSIYVLLGRLEEKGFVRVKQPPAGETNPGKARPRYFLTGEGARALRYGDSLGIGFGAARA